jgi:glutaredoxin/uncharacterized membrane protein
LKTTSNPYEKVFIGLNLLGGAFLAAEIFLQSTGRSICVTEGCKIVSRYTRFGDISILLLGLVTFSMLAFLALWNLFREKPAFGSLIDGILVISLACEGFLTGYQAFRTFQPCVSCLIVLAVVVMLGLVRILGGHGDVAAGFGAMIAVFGLLFLILPAGGSPPLDPKDRVILFYSDGCRHCAAVEKHLEEKHMPFKKLNSREYSAFLEILGIGHVPTLVINDNYEKHFLTGEKSIRNYLSVMKPEETRGDGLSGSTIPSAARKPAGPSDRAEKSIKPAERPAKTGTMTPTDNVASPSGKSLPLLIPPPSDEEGLCKKDENCD